MPVRAEMHDVLVVGAGVSGTAAAALLARASCDVLLLEAEKQGSVDRGSDWVNPGAENILREAGVSTAPLLKHRLQRFVLFSADFTSSREANVPAEPVYVVKHADLRHALLETFQDGTAGRSWHQARVERLQLGEDSVTAYLAGGRSVSGRLLVIATGAGRALVDQIQFAGGTTDAPGGLGVRYCCPADPRAEEARMDYVLGLGDPAAVGYRLSYVGGMTVGVFSDRSAEFAVSSLQEMSSMFCNRGLLPKEWQSFASGAAPYPSPAGLSLVMESHVAKRTLVIGRAGGFVASYTHEALYPCLWSAKLACEAIVKALRSSNIQDSLQAFEHLWRTELAGRLRPPNTDPQSILPLIFSNQRMADKLIESFHLGTKF